MCNDKVSCIASFTFSIITIYVVCIYETDVCVELKYVNILTTDAFLAMHWYLIATLTPTLN